MYKNVSEKILQNRCCFLQDFILRANKYKNRKISLCIWLQNQEYLLVIFLHGLDVLNEFAFFEKRGLLGNDRDVYVKMDVGINIDKPVFGLGMSMTIT